MYVCLHICTYASMWGCMSGLRTWLSCECNVGHEPFLACADWDGKLLGIMSTIHGTRMSCCGVSEPSTPYFLLCVVAMFAELPAYAGDTNSAMPYTFSANMHDNDRIIQLSLFISSCMQSWYTCLYPDRPEVCPVPYHARQGSCHLASGLAYWLILRVSCISLSLSRCLKMHVAGRHACPHMSLRTHETKQWHILVFTNFARLHVPEYVCRSICTRTPMYVFMHMGLPVCFCICMSVCLCTRIRAFTFACMDLHLYACTRISMSVCVIAVVREAHTYVCPHVCTRVSV